MRKKETIRHKKETRRRYERNRMRATIKLIHNHKKEYKKIFAKIKEKEKKW